MLSCAMCVARMLAFSFAPANMCCFSRRVHSSSFCNEMAASVGRSGDVSCLPLAATWLHAPRVASTPSRLVRGGRHSAGLRLSGAVGNFCNGDRRPGGRRAAPRVAAWPVELMAADKARITWGGCYYTTRGGHRLGPMCVAWPSLDFRQGEKRR